MRILITSKSFGRCAPEALDFLKTQGFELVRGSKPTMTAEEIAREVPGFDVLVVGNDTIDRKVIDAGTCLKLIHMNGTGVDGIDVDYASEKGIFVANAPGVNRNAVAELAVALMLVSARSIDRHIDLMKKGGWERAAGVEVSGKTVGILGLGNIGKRVVELLSGFGVRVVAFDPEPDTVWAVSHQVKLAASVDEVLPEADFIVLALPYTPQTRYILSSARIKRMKPQARIINTARGGLIDEKALCEALKAGEIAGAALDAFEEEPPPMDSPLRTAGLTLTPHMAATTVETASSVSWIIAHNIVDILLGKKAERALNCAAIEARRDLGSQAISLKY
jgi:D-3-phosphoglycerate dehydrogenase